MTTNEFSNKRIFVHNAEIEALLGRRYALLFSETKTKLAELYASMDDDISLENARKYSRFTKLLDELNYQHEKLTGFAINEAEKLSAYNYTEQYFLAHWQAEMANGDFKWKNPQVEAIRSSVYWEGTGMDIPKRFGKNISGQMESVESAITRGLANGDGFAKTAEAIKNEFTKGFNDAVRVVRTESTRNRSEGLNSAYESIKESGLPVRKVWISTNDDRTRGQRPSDKYDHLILDGLEANKDGLFDVGQGIGLIEGPAQSGEPSFDINCRCTTGLFFDDEGERASYKDLEKNYSEWASKLGHDGSWSKADQALN